MNKQKTWIVALVFLLMSFVQFSWAETNQEEHAAEIMNRAAKTPEEFMRRVKAVWDKPGMRIQEVAETITGVEIKWFKRHPLAPPEDKGRILGMEYKTYPKSPYDGGYDDYDPPRLDQKTGKTLLGSFGLGFNGKRVQGEAERILCITPALTKEIFGEPDRIDRTGIRMDISGSIAYLYTDGRRTLTFKYNGIGGNSLFRHRFEEHKNACMGRFRFEQEQ